MTDEPQEPSEQPVEEKAEQEDQKDSATHINLRASKNIEYENFQMEVIKLLAVLEVRSRESYERLKRVERTVWSLRPEGDIPVEEGANG